MGFHSSLIRPAIYWGGGSFGGGTLDSHDLSFVQKSTSTRLGYEVVIHILDLTGVIMLPIQTMHYSIREILEKYHRFVLFDSPQMGNIMTPV